MGLRDREKSISTRAGSSELMNMRCRLMLDSTLDWSLPHSASLISLKSRVALVDASSVCHSEGESTILKCGPGVQHSLGPMCILYSLLSHSRLSQATCTG